MSRLSSSTLITDHAHTSSAFRRKPQVTYKSPSKDSFYTIGPISLTAIPPKSASSSSILQPTTSKVSSDSANLGGTKTSRKHKKYTMGPPLPLYHPLGPLALSLPPLDPASVGLPTPIRSDDAARDRRSSARARRPAAKLRDVEDELQVPALMATTITIPDVESREKPSPRKRRIGGSSKRKRREVDDGDATYPAKRTRIPRGAANHLIVGDEQPPLEPSVAEVTPTPEPMPEASDDRKPERRSTRSRGSLKRRDSSASDATSSVSTPAIAIAKGTETVEVDKHTGTITSQHPGDTRVIDEKEEGELSEDGQPISVS